MGGMAASWCTYVGPLRVVALQLALEGDGCHEVLAAGGLSRLAYGGGICLPFMVDMDWSFGNDGWIGR
jgi:hypothetical protein